MVQKLLTFAFSIGLGGAAATSPSSCAEGDDTCLSQELDEASLIQLRSRNESFKVPNMLPSSDSGGGLFQATRPSWSEYAKVARWLVYMSDYAIAETKCSEVRNGCAKVNDPFGNIMSTSGGNHSHSSGNIFAYLPDLDPSPADLTKDPVMTVTYTEKAMGKRGTCGSSTAENPPCARLTIAGKMTKLPASGALYDEGWNYLKAKHPEMAYWPSSHGWSIWWMDPKDIASFFFLDQYGPAHTFTVDEYLAADPLAPAKQTAAAKPAPKAVEPNTVAPGASTTFHATRPWFVEYAKMARWLVYMSDYTVAGTLCSSVRDGCSEIGAPFGNIMSISGGNSTYSSGAIYTYLPEVDPSPTDLAANPTVSLTFSEKALGSRGSCGGSTAENPPCARLTIAGEMAKVPDDKKDEAWGFLTAKHPEMAYWPTWHGWSIYWLVPEKMESFFILDMYGPAYTFTVDEYFKASPL